MQPLIHLNVNKKIYVKLSNKHWTHGFDHCKTKVVSFDTNDYIRMSQKYLQDYIIIPYHFGSN
jgi:hypothetical protein